MEIHKLLLELEFGYTYTITFGETQNRECYDLWLDKEDTFYCLQEIHMLDGVPVEVGSMTQCNKTEIVRKLTEFSQQDQYIIREWG